MKQAMIAACLLAIASAAEIKYADGTYVQHYTTSGNSIATNNNAPPHGGTSGAQGFGVQTGYEGYLVPTKASSDGQRWHDHRGLLAGLLLPMAKLPLLALPFTGGLGTTLLALTALVGGAALLCSFTPVCGFNPLGLGRYYLNQDNLNSATAFVMDAIEKHRGTQKNVNAEEEE